MNEKNRTYLQTDEHTQLQSKRINSVENNRNNRYMQTSASPIGEDNNMMKVDYFDYLFDRLNKTQIKKNIITVNKVPKAPKSKEKIIEEDKFFERMSLVTLQKDKIAKKNEIEESKIKEKHQKNRKYYLSPDFVEKPIFDRLSKIKKNKQTLKKQDQDIIKQEQELIYKKKIISSKTPPPNVKNLLNRLHNFEEAHKIKIAEQRKLKYLNEMSEVRNPEINKISRQLITNTTFSDRQEIFKIKKEKKIDEIKKFTEKKLNSFINSKINNIKVDKKTVSSTIDSMLKWGEDKKHKHEQELKKNIEKNLIECTFRPVLNPNSIKMIKKENNEDIITITMNNFDHLNTGRNGNDNQYNDKYVILNENKHSDKIKKYSKLTVEHINNEYVQSDENLEGLKFAKTDRDTK